MKKTRRYRQGARAVAALQTRERILDVAEALFWERDPDDITLEVIAERAGVTVQTVLRRFGSKDDLFQVALEERAGNIAAERKPAAPDARSAVAALVASYERMGDANWRILRHEDRYPLLHQAMTRARTLHRQWLHSAFEGALPVDPVERERAVDALFTVLDFYVWKLHRRDLGRSREETEVLMLDLVGRIIGSGRAP